MKSNRNIHLIVGARPNFMKADPVYKALADNNNHQLTMVHTGQHYDHKMSQLFFDDLGMKTPDIALQAGSGTHGVQTALILERYEAIIIKNRPDLVIVFGDVNSTIACALAAIKLHIPVAHVEAGLRSFDRHMPEEINRVLTDSISNLLFTTSQNADENLLREGANPESIHFVGNTMIDSLRALSLKFEQSLVHSKLNINDPYALITLHRPSNVDDPVKLENLVTALEQTSAIILCLFPIHPRTLKNMDRFGLLERLKKNANFRFIDPLGYIDFMRLQRDAAVVITDSGGIQGESTSFGVPCLTIRENTEHIVTLTEGTNKLIGISYSNIPTEVETAIKNPHHNDSIPKFWDGKSSRRITGIINGIDFDGFFN